MYIFIFALSALILLILLVFFIIKRADQTAKPVSNIKLAFYHQNGNLDFYVTTDNEFISRIHNHQFNLQDVERKQQQMKPSYLKKHAIMYNSMQKKSKNYSKITLDMSHTKFI